MIVRKLVAGLRKWGVRPGQKGLHVFKDIMYPMILSGIIGAGFIFAGTNPSCNLFEIAHHMRISETNFIITEPEILGPVLTAMVSHHNLIAEHNSLWEDDERDYNVKRLLVMPMFRVGVLALALSHRLAPGVHNVLTYFRNATSLYNGILSCQL